MFHHTNTGPAKRWSSVKKVSAIACATALISGGIILGTAGPALAHAGNAQTTFVCVGGQFDVTEKVSWTNVPGGVTGTIESHEGTSSFASGWDHSTFTTWDARGSTSGATGSTSWDYTLPGDTTSAPWIYVFITWSDGYSQQKQFDDRAENLPTNCHPAPLIAEASVSITPATCTSGEKLVYGDDQNATPSGTADGTTGPASYNTVYTGDGGATFTTGTGAISGDGTTETFSGNLSGPLNPNDYPDCRGPVPPIQVTYSDGEPYWDCSTPGVLQAGEISYVHYTHTATATWDSTQSKYVFGAPVTTSEVLTIPTPDGFDATCPATVLVTPPALSADPPSCQKAGSFTPPAVVPEHETFAVTPALHGPDDYVGTYTTDTGWTFASGTTVSYPFTILPKKDPSLCNVLALTGTNPWPYIGAGGGLLLLGGVLFTLGVAGRRRKENVVPVV